ncbi:MAG: sensor domain-containing protein [Mycobacteriaceae bacterium]
MINRLPAMTAVLCLAVSGCGSTTAGTAMPSAPIPPTNAQTLPALLLSAPEVADALGGGELVVSGEVDAPWNDATHFQGAGEAGCLAIAGAAQKGVYADAGWAALHGQVLREPPTARSWSHFVTQAVVLFGDAAAASGFLRAQRQSWSGCSDRELRYTQSMAPDSLAPDQVWAVGPTLADRDLLTVSRVQRSPQHWFCQRALTVHANVGVDVEACSLGGPTSAAAAIAGRIGDRLPSA